MTRMYRSARAIIARTKLTSGPSVALPSRALSTSMRLRSVATPDSNIVPGASNPPGVRKPVEPNDPALRKQQDAHVRQKDSASPDKVGQNDATEPAGRASGERSGAGAGMTGDAGMQKGPNKGDGETLVKGKEAGKEAGGTETPGSG